MWTAPAGAADDLHPLPEVRQPHLSGRVRVMATPVDNPPTPAPNGPDPHDTGADKPNPN
jgi:hypothetical protein